MQESLEGWRDSKLKKVNIGGQKRAQELNDLWGRRPLLYGSKKSNRYVQKFCTAVLPLVTAVLPRAGARAVPSVLLAVVQRYYRSGTVEPQERYYRDLTRYYRWPTISN